MDDLRWRLEDHWLTLKDRVLRRIRTPEIPDGDNINILRGSGGRPATTEELIRFANKHQARSARKRRR